MTMLGVELQINMFRIEDVAVVVIHGEMDACAAPSVSAAFGSLGTDEHLYVDAADVLFVDNEGLRPLVEAAQRNMMFGGPLHVRASAALRSLIEINGEAHLFAFD